MSSFKRFMLAIGVVFILGIAAFLVVITTVGILSGGFPMTGQRIGLVRVEGMIMNTEDLVDLTRRYADDEMVLAILVRIDSGGGAVGASQELYTELLRARTRKPVIVSCGNACASGGYYIALAGDQIFVNPGTLTGSVGVLMNHLDTSGLVRDRLGIDVTEVTSRENKDIASIHGPLTDEDRELIMEMLTDVHGQFVGAVRENRGESIMQVLANQLSCEPSEVPEVALDEHLIAHCDGRPWTGTQALELGFVDRLGNFQDAIDLAAQRAGIEGTPQIEEPREHGGLLGPLVHSAVDDLSAQLREEMTVQAPLRFQSPAF